MRFRIGSKPPQVRKQYGEFFPLIDRASDLTFLIALIVPFDT